MTSTAESPLRAQGKGPGLKLAVLSHGEVSCSFYRFRPGQDSWKSRGGRQQRKHVLKRNGKRAGLRAIAHILEHALTSIALSLLHYCSSMGFLIQTHAFCGTDVDIVIQTVIQTHAFYGTDVQTVQ